MTHLLTMILYLSLRIFHTPLHPLRFSDDRKSILKTTLTVYIYIRIRDSPFQAKSLQLQFQPSADFSHKFTLFFFRRLNDRGD